MPGRAPDRTGQPSTRRPVAPSRAAAVPAAPVTTVDGLQRAAGNAAVRDLLRGAGPEALQRVAISYTDTGETLYNQTRDVNRRVPQGEAQAAAYGEGNTIAYDMTRTGTPAPAQGATPPAAAPGGGAPAGESVRVVVKIKFVSQVRRADGSYARSDRPIPEGDPRRDFASTMCTNIVRHWNGRLTLAGKQRGTPTLPKPGEPAVAPPSIDVRLPVTFVAEPVFDLAADAHTSVAVFGTGRPADPTSGNPIDAGNWYMNKGRRFYQGMDPEMIYAHEYGHLVGLNDEYSQSNVQAHALLHRMNPASALTAGNDLDRETVKRMVLAALTPPLLARLGAVAPGIGAALAAARPALTATVVRSLGEVVADESLAAVLNIALEPVPARVAALRDKSVAAALAAARGSAANQARAAAAAVMRPGAIARMLDVAYRDALRGVMTAEVSLGATSMHIQVVGSAADRGGRGSGVWGAAASGANAGHAGTVVDASIGLPRGRARLPPVQPSGSLLAELSALPATWSAAAGSPGPQLEAGAVNADLVDALLAASEARRGATGATTQAGLTAVAARLLVNAAGTAARSAMARFLDDQVGGAARRSVSQLAARVKTEVDAIVGTPAGAVAAASPSDPALRALATSMHTRLQDKVNATKAATPAGSTDLHPGEGGPNQEVTYSTVNIMSDNTTAVRPDQFSALVKQFNDHVPHLRRADEDPFTAVTA